MIPVLVINNESLIEGLPDISFVNTYQYRRNGILASKVLKYDPNKHNNFITHDDIGLFNWNYLETVLDKETEYLIKYPVTHYSTSIGPATFWADIEDGIYVAKSFELSYEDLLHMASVRIGIMKKLFGCSLSFENTAFRSGNSAYYYIATPRFIGDLVEKNDVGFTLDIAHAIITAYALGMPIRIYLSKLPLDRCVEVHLSLPSLTKGDTHDLPHEGIMNLFNHVKPMIDKDAYVVVEYYRDMDKLKDFYENTLRRYIE